MATYILTWNPSRYDWEADGLQDEIGATVDGQWVDGRWSVRYPTMLPGDRALLMRQRTDRGLVASGEFTGDFEMDSDFEDATRDRQYASLRFEHVLPYEDRLPVEELIARLPGFGWNDSLRSSGMRIPGDLEDDLYELWEEHLAQLGRHQSRGWRSGEEREAETYDEGERTLVAVSRYERDPRARKACLDHYGFRCAVCGFDFGDTYGEEEHNPIHVHHLKPLSITKKTTVDPTKDLRPVCPNCHAMLHTQTPPMSIRLLRSRLRPAAE